MNSSAMFTCLANTPIPRDLQLPLPLPEGVLVFLLVIFFLVHILFVNLMVGGSVFVLFFEVLGLKKKGYDDLAHEIAKTVTVNKSLAVVMGIGPLLCINLLYTMQWYSANALTGHAWLLIVPLVTIAFLLTYLHKYTWDRWNTGGWKRLHLAVGAIATLLLLFVPLIFLANVNLMLFPSEWEKVKGFFSSLEIGNVFPRYLHFLAASLAMTGLFLAGWYGRKGADLSALPDFTGPGLRRHFYRICWEVTAAQFLIGPLLLFTLPAAGITTKLYVIILSGAAVGALALYVLSRELKRDDARIGGLYVPVCILFSIVVLGMGSGRHVYREAALATHQRQIRERTESYSKALAEFNKSHANLQQTAALSVEQLFMNCAACHAPKVRLVGPSLVEISEIYAGNPQGIVTWAKAPGKKRPELPPMPPFAHLGDENLRQIAEYMLRKAKE